MSHIVIWFDSADDHLAPVAGYGWAVYDGNEKRTTRRE